MTWVILGLGLLLIALSGGPSGALQRLQSQSRGSRRAAIVLFAIALLVLGVGVPLAVISSVEARDDIPEANVSNLTSAEEHGGSCSGAAARSATRSRPPSPSRRSARTWTRCARRRRSCWTRSRRAGPVGRARWRPASTRARTPRTSPNTWRRPSGRRARVSSLDFRRLCRKHGKVALSRLFHRCYDAASHRLNTCSGAAGATGRRSAGAWARARQTTP